MGNKPPLNALTGLRFVAAAVVFIHHLGGKFGFENNVYCLGSMAVTFFFVLSGFILTYVYHDRFVEPKTKRKYLFTRFARIWPLHFVCLLIFLFSMLSWDTFEQPLTWWKLLANGTLLQSWVPYGSWIEQFNVVSWSISDEAFFYLIFPLLFVGKGKLSSARTTMLLGLVLVAIFGIHICSRMQFADWDYSYIGHFNPLVRLPEFLVGVLTGQLFLKNVANPSRGNGSTAGFWLDTVRELLCIVAVVAAGYFFRQFRIEHSIATAAWGSEFLSSWSRVIFPVLIFAASIFVFANSRGVFARFVSHPFAVYLGEISFAFYMIHFIVLRIVSLYSPSYGELNGFAIAACCFAISVGVSALLFSGIEVPAKSALLNWHGKEGGSFAANLVSQIWKTIWHWSIPIAIFVVAISSAILIANIPNQIRSPAVAEIFANSQPELRNIKFGSEVELLGCQVVPKQNQTILKLAWRKRTDQTRRRLVRILDDNSKVIGRGNHADKAFAAANNGDEFEDEVRLPNEILSQANTVEVSFRGKSVKALKATGSPRIQQKRGLIVLNAAEIAAIVSGEFESQAENSIGEQ